MFPLKLLKWKEWEVVKFTSVERDKNVITVARCNVSGAIIPQPSDLQVN
jgi:hypothetical protein